MLLSGRSLVSPQADPSASLGDEAPLSADGRERRTIEGRGINMRWFSGTVLTGLCGAGLMGGGSEGSGRSLRSRTPQTA